MVTAYTWIHMSLIRTEAAPVLGATWWVFLLRIKTNILFYPYIKLKKAWMNSFPFQATKQDITWFVRQCDVLVFIVHQVQRHHCIAVSTSYDWYQMESWHLFSHITSTASMIYFILHVYINNSVKLNSCNMETWACEVTVLTSAISLVW